MDWSIVIPAYNEATRLPAYLTEVVAYFERRGDAFEVVIVDDGSVDGTASIAHLIGNASPTVRVSVLPKNRGKGFAVRVGMLQATGRFRLMTDADGATPIAEIARLEAALGVGAVAVGSRVLRDGSVVRHTLLHRRLSGAVFNFIVRCMGVKNVADSQCGFKLFRGDVADDLFSAMQTDGYGFDVELLLLAQKRGYRVVEVPVNWSDRPGSKVHVVADGARMLRQIAVARWRLRQSRSHAVGQSRIVRLFSRARAGPGSVAKPRRRIGRWLKAVLGKPFAHR